MGHHISAVVLKGPFDAERAATFDLRTIDIGHDLTVFPLDPYYCDYWAEKLAIPGFAGGPILNCDVIHHMIRDIADEPLFAVIETNYFGGHGDQCAVVYHGERKVMGAMTSTVGPINSAIRMLGIYPNNPLDEFDTVGLRRYRDWDGLFEEYED